MSKKIKAALITIGVILLLGTCVLSVSVYAKKIINKPKFNVPAEIQTPTDYISDEKNDRLDYIQNHYESVFTDETVISHSITVAIPEDSITTDMTSDDEAILRYSINNYLDYLDSLYIEFDANSGDLITESKPLSFKPEEVNDVIITEDTMNDNGEVSNTDNYYFNIEVPGMGYITFDDVSSKLCKTFGIDKNVDILDKFEAELSPMLEINNLHIELNDCSVSGNINKFRSQLNSIKFTHSYTVEATVQFIGDYLPLGVADLKFDYIIEEEYNIDWYGLYFTKHNLYMNPKNEELLPLAVNIAKDAEKSDYELTFVSDNESVATVDNDGFITAVSSSDKPAVITAKLKYKGYEYTDYCYVTVTDLEVVE